MIKIWQLRPYWPKSRVALRHEVGVKRLTDVLQQVEALAEPADAGQVVPKFDQPWVRELIHPPLRIVYRLDCQQVWIACVWRREPLPGRSAARQPGLPGI